MFGFMYSGCKKQFNHGLVEILFRFTVCVILLPYGESVTEDDEQIPYKFAFESTFPGAIVFNIDELLWPYKVDKVMTPPLRAGRNQNEIRDRMGKIYRLFNNTRAILDDLFVKCYSLGGLVISTDPEKIEEIMNLYDINRYFQFFEVFPKTPGCKVKHMKRMSQRLGADFNEILYFDAGEDQLDEVEGLAVTTVQVSPRLGLTYDVLRHGFGLYLAAHNASWPYKQVNEFTESPVNS